MVKFIVNSQEFHMPLSKLLWKKNTCSGDFIASVWEKKVFCELVGHMLLNI